MNKLASEDILLQRYKISKENFQETGLEWNELEDIHSHFLSIQQDINLAGKSILERLISIENVHSVRYRIKDAEHLILKIIRKKIANKDRVIDKGNYLSEITDLIGLRIIHLYKNSWLPIHQNLMYTFDIHETPRVYYRTGDDADYLKEFKEVGIAAEEHLSGYRSIHYVIVTKPTKQVYFAEIQVRTIFEEGWSEIDHDVRYPYETDNILYNTISLILNRLAGSADELAMFIVAMRTSIKENTQEINRLKEIIDKSNLGIEEKEEVKAGISSTNVMSEIIRQHLTHSSNYSAKVASIMTPSVMQALTQVSSTYQPFTGSLASLAKIAAIANKFNNSLSELNFPSQILSTDTEGNEIDKSATTDDEDEADTTDTEK